MEKENSPWGTSVGVGGKKKCRIGWERQPSAQYVGWIPRYPYISGLRNWMLPWFQSAVGIRCGGRRWGWLGWVELDDAGYLNSKVWSLHLIQNIFNMFTDFSLVLAYPTLYLCLECLLIYRKFTYAHLPSHTQVLLYPFQIRGNWNFKDWCLAKATCSASSRVQYLDSWCCIIFHRWIVLDGKFFIVF